MATPNDGEKSHVLDLLYEGGDESGLDEAGRRELETWRELRGVMREIGDATESEPPDTVGILMAAARERAPAPRGIWARMRGWFTVMIAHPAMSAAATVVVVGGIAGALYVSGQVGSETHATESASGGAATKHEEAPPPATASAGSGSAAGSAAVAATETEGKAPEVPKVDLPRSAGPVTGAPAVEHRPARHGNAPGASGHASGPVDDDRSAQQIARGEVSGGLRSDLGGTGGGEGQGQGRAGKDHDGAADKLEDNMNGETVTRRPAGKPTAPAPSLEPVPMPPPEADEAPVAAPPPPPPPPPAPPAAPAPKTPTTSSTTTRPSDQKPAEPPKKSAAQAAELTRQAKSAAKKKDCKTVDALANRVLELDEGYYRASFAPDPDIRDNCASASKK